MSLRVRGNPCASKPPVGGRSNSPPMRYFSNSTMWTYPLVSLWMPIPISLRWLASKAGRMLSSCIASAICSASCTTVSVVLRRTPRHTPLLLTLQVSSIACVPAGIQLLNGSFKSKVIAACLEAVCSPLGNLIERLAFSQCYSTIFTALIIDQPQQTCAVIRWLRLGSSGWLRSWRSGWLRSWRCGWL